MIWFFKNNDQTYKQTKLHENFTYLIFALWFKRIVLRFG